jgi:ABC-2 type transport system permease protein
VAFIVGMAICFGLTLVDQMLFFVPRALLGTLTYMAVDFHFQNIAKGILDTRDIVYFLSLGFIGLYGTSLVLKAKH